MPSGQIDLLIPPDLEIHCHHLRYYYYYYYHYYNHYTPRKNGRRGGRDPLRNRFGHAWNGGGIEICREFVVNRRQMISSDRASRDRPSRFLEILEIRRVDACTRFLGLVVFFFLFLFFSSRYGSRERWTRRLARRQDCTINGRKSKRRGRIRADSIRLDSIERMYILYINKNWLSDRWAAGNRISSSRSCLVCPSLDRAVSLSHLNPSQVSPAGFFAQMFAWPVDRQRFAVPFFSPIGREKYGMREREMCGKGCILLRLRLRNSS